MLVLKELEVLKRARGLVGYIVGSADLGRLSKPWRGALDMAEVAGPNPAEPITYFKHITPESAAIASNE